jgi:hypothetical protein
MFLQDTVDSVLANMRGDTEIIVVLDGYWPEKPIPDHPKLTLIHHTTPVGQRRGVNEAAAMSNARYLMKLDAHCCVDEGFDVKLAAPYENKTLDGDVTTIPRMYNLHVFDWVCNSCKHRLYQGPTPVKCPHCGYEGDSIPAMSKEMVWKPRLSRCTDFMRFDNQMVFQYWREYGKRPQAQHDIADLLSSVGACFFMPRRRFRKLGGMDEKHNPVNGWGQFGTEVSCKSWLSGGRQVVNKTTWFSHMFRTQGGDFGFPYQISGRDQEKAREYSRWLWKEGNWKHAVHPLSWLIDKFSPVPTWNGTGG